MMKVTSWAAVHPSWPSCSATEAIKGYSYMSGMHDSHCPLQGSYNAIQRQASGPQTCQSLVTKLLAPISSLLMLLIK